MHLLTHALRRGLATIIALLVLLPITGSSRPVPALAQTPAPTLRGGFAEFWQAHNGALLFGAPITGEMESRGLTVQYFERARLEWHPDFPPGRQITLGRLGAELLGDRALPPIAAFASSAAHRYFAATRHSIQGEIGRFWASAGGLPIFGYPLSEEQTEDGMTVQYFERARLEWHPELAGTGYGVLPSPLGALRAPAGATTAAVLEPPLPQAGHVAMLKVLLPPGAGEPSVLFDGRKVAVSCCRTLTVAGTPHSYAWALVATDPARSGSSVALTVSAAAGSGPAWRLARAVAVRGYPYPTVHLPDNPYPGPRPPPGAEPAEHDFLRDLVSTGGPPAWHAVWQQPLSGTLMVNSAFAEHRYYGSNPSPTIHGGVDLDADAGTAIRAPAAGRVVFAGPLQIRGNATVIDHGAGVYSLYAHQSVLRVKVGQQLEAGDLIGLVGTTGRSTGPHLHWEVYAAGMLVDPFDWLRRAYP